MKKVIRKMAVLCIAVGMFVSVLNVFNANDVYAADVWEDAYLYWNTYNDSDNGVKIHKIKDETYIYIGYRAKSAEGAAVTYANVGYKIKYENTGYYIYVLKHDSMYMDEKDNKTVDGYVYNLVRIRVTDIYALFEKKYPDVDFSTTLRNPNKTNNIYFDSIMTYRRDGVSKTYKSIAEDGKGGLNINGHVYCSAASFREAYKIYTGVTLDNTLETQYFNKHYAFPGVRTNKVPGVVSLPTISTTGITFTGTTGAYYKKDNNYYYVRANTDFSLSFSSNVNLALASYQANRNELMVSGFGSGYYLDTANVSGGTSASITGKGGSTNNKYTLVSYSQNRSGYATLKSKFTLKQTEQTGEVKYYGKGHILQSGADAVTPSIGAAITVKADGTGPIITSQGNTQWTSATYKLNASARDNISGMKKIEILDSKGNVLSSGTSSCTYNVTASGLTQYTVRATDNVGNVSTKTVSVYRDTEAPQITISNPNDSNPETPETSILEDSKVIGWINYDYLLNVTAEDIGPSGMKEVYLMDTITHAKLAEGVNSLSYKFTNEGEHNYILTAKDNAGNVKIVYLKVKIDKTAPTIKGNDEEGMYKGSALDFYSYDVGGSGLKKFEIYDESGNLLSGNEHTENTRAYIKYKIKENYGLSYKFVAYDNAGNKMEYEVATPYNFSVRATVTSDAVNEKESTEDETKYVFLAGEKGYLNIDTFGYVDTLEIQFDRNQEGVANKEDYSLNYLLEKQNELTNEAIILEVPKSEDSTYIEFKVPENFFNIFSSYREARKADGIVKITAWRDGYSKSITLPMLLVYDYTDYIYVNFRRVIVR